MINQSGQKEEQEYYETVVGLHGEFLFADTIQEARLKIITGQGYMPVDVIGEQNPTDMILRYYEFRLCAMGNVYKKTYALFWKKTISNGCVSDFADILKSRFSL